MAATSACGFVCWNIYEDGPEGIILAKIASHHEGFPPTMCGRTTQSHRWRMPGGAPYTGKTYPVHRLHRLAKTSGPSSCGCFREVDESCRIVIVTPQVGPKPRGQKAIEAAAQSREGPMKSIIRTVLLSGAFISFAPEVVLAASIEKKGSTSYVTHFVFHPLSSHRHPERRKGHRTRGSRAHREHERRADARQNASQVCSCQH